MTSVSVGPHQEGGYDDRTKRGKVAGRSPKRLRKGSKSADFCMGQASPTRGMVCQKIRKFCGRRICMIPEPKRARALRVSYLNHIASAVVPKHEDDDEGQAW